MALKRKDLLGLRGLSRVEIEEILTTAEEMKSLLLSGSKESSLLQNKSVVTLFYENSTRTRFSFEFAAKYLGAHTASVAVSSSSVAKGESLIDTGKTIQSMGVDVIVIRHPMSGAPHLLAKHVSASVINAGDGINEHPTQALLDMFTMKEKKGAIDGLRVAIIGDILHSRVARSNIWGLTTMGAEVRVAGPPTLMPPDIDKMGVKVFYKVEEAIKDADVVMGLRLQKERQQKGLLPSLREYTRLFGITEERIRLAAKDALIMHPGPVNRGVEIASELVDGEQSVINQQVTNGVAVRMALLYLLMGRNQDAVY
ncbi:aspartate carbamoyltransferase catalytic subunit [Caldicoprobacter guelmensis]|uniref:aspartate carbamoyltransferase catalytic subunit n=1 Tax=Caldicoprobacter guelmensis TaxID=1170224 RepID=UPI00195B077F|nr:aspartate carbamoyltransferase catalytic subunit [Caldicoprobacter guelmensis]MBM7581984.1 aspartate carbamoyltransferase catalytic subunit [Caldicoprobacter guelmensis]